MFLKSVSWGFSLEPLHSVVSLKWKFFTPTAGSSEQYVGVWRMLYGFSP